MWDPAQYLRFAVERSRPFCELLARVGAEDPKRIADLGCGPGSQTAELAARPRFGRRLPRPLAEAEMLRLIETPDPAAARIRWVLGDLRTGSPASSTT
jgi:trans-aconitate 2-methyltransferase